jgi:hypothetical protein
MNCELYNDCEVFGLAGVPTILFILKILIKILRFMSDNSVKIQSKNSVCQYSSASSCAYSIAIHSLF